MARTPIDVYRGLIQTRLDDDALPHMRTVVGQFSNQVFFEQKLSNHLTRFLELWAKLLAYLDSRYITAFSDLEASIDVLDYFTSATKWWMVSRKKPGLIFRPPSHEPREFLKSITSLKFSSGALSRISAAVDKLTRFLDEHKTGESSDRQALCDSMHSSWTLLSAFTCMSQGRNVTSENDFETAYDIVRVLLFYLPPEDFRALTAIRKIGTNRNLSKIAAVELSTGFERKLGSSVAARLERELEKSIVKAVSSYSGAYRNMLTDSLRILVQIQASRIFSKRIEEGDYESLSLGAIDMLEKVGISQELFREEKAVVNLFKKITPAEGIAERVALTIRRLEGLIADSIGNRDFLLQYNKLVPRMISLLLLLASSTKTSLKEGLQDIDLKRGLILFSNIFNV